MEKNIIQLLKSGNQELFYSSFISWLLDETGEHGLEGRFGKWFFEKLGLEFKPFRIETEKRIAGGRADIYLTVDGGKDIVIENKTKSMGSSKQIFAYDDNSNIVVPLGLVFENFPKGLRSRVLTYSDILDFLRENKLHDGALSVLVEHFSNYLESMLLPFQLVDRFCKGEIEYEQVKIDSKKVQVLPLNDNDKRFFQAVYYERLINFIQDNYSDLIFGSKGYHDKKTLVSKPNATRWIVEKDLRGCAFMEAIIYSTSVPHKMHIRKEWSEVIVNASDPDLAPRLELSIGPYNVFQVEQVGIFQIGSWDKGMKKEFQNSGRFKKRGSRNFHYRTLRIEDLKYETMASIIREEMEKVWEFE